MKKMLYAIVLLVFAAGISAADLTTKSGKVYKNFAIMGAHENGVLVFHDEGKSAIPPEEFPDEYKEKVEKYARMIPAKKKEAAQRRAANQRKAKADAAQKKKQDAERNARMKKYLAEEAKQKKKEADAKRAADAKTIAASKDQKFSSKSSGSSGSSSRSSRSSSIVK